MSKHYTDTEYDFEAAEYRSRRAEDEAQDRFDAERDDGLTAPAPPYIGSPAIGVWAQECETASLVHFRTYVSSVRAELAAAEALAERYIRAGHDAIQERQDIVWPVLRKLTAAEKWLEFAESSLGQQQQMAAE